MRERERESGGWGGGGGGGRGDTGGRLRGFTIFSEAIVENHNVYYRMKHTSLPSDRLLQTPVWSLENRLK